MCFLSIPSLPSARHEPRLTRGGSDHDIDQNYGGNQITIYTGRGLLVESRSGPLWLYGTSVEHFEKVQYSLYGAGPIVSLPLLPPPLRKKSLIARAGPRPNPNRNGILAAPAQRLRNLPRQRRLPRPRLPRDPLPQRHRLQHPQRRRPRPLHPTKPLGPHLRRRALLVFQQLQHHLQQRRQWRGLSEQDRRD